MKRVIHWFRRDLRLHDNTGLAEAARRSENVIPVFILEDAFRSGPDVGGARLRFLLRSLEELGSTLKDLGYSLIIRHGKSEEELPKLARELDAEAVFANIRYEPYAQQRDARAYKALNDTGAGFELFKDAAIWHEREILTQAGRPFTVFTPYSKAWLARKAPGPQTALRKNPGRAIVARSDELPADSIALGHSCSQEIMPAGEKAALKALDAFLAGPVFDYDTNRNLVDVDGTSRLSAHLRAGTIGIRTILARLEKAKAGTRAAAARRSCDVFLNELIWREFYLQVLHNYPHVMRGAFRPEYDTLKWSDNEEHFRSWSEGRTGYPIVDAAMRCMNATGWMHNRLRMICAMFLTKDLLINWQWGERYFMKQLVDGDLAANNGGWQWSAGTGTDAAPYFRIFNPVTQGKKCDPDGKFVLQWVPELEGLEGADVHEPWKEPLLASRYCHRVVLHEEQRIKALAMFAAARQRAS